MNILIIGSGAREHAIAKALKRTTSSSTLFCYGSHVNPGIHALVEEHWTGDLSNVDVILEKAKRWNIQLTIIGPEGPLAFGLADNLWKANIPTIGPTKKNAQIEANKSFARDLMKKYQIQGLVPYQTFSNGHFLQLTEMHCID